LTAECVRILSNTLPQILQNSLKRGQSHFYFHKIIGIVWVSDMIDVHLTKNELKLLKTVFILEQDLIDKIDGATLDGDKYTIEFSYDELDELTGYVASEANHAKSEARRDKLDRLCDKMESLLEDYEREERVE